MDNSAGYKADSELNKIKNEAGAGLQLQTPFDTYGAEGRANDAFSWEEGKSFRLSYEKDGVYLETAADCGFDSCIREKVISHLKRKNIKQLNMDEAVKALNNSPYRVCIAPAQEEFFYNEQAIVTISADQMEAYLSLLPPDTGGSCLTYSELAEEVASQGVSYGVDETILKNIIKSKMYGEKISFAKGTLPENGRDGELIFYFNTECLGTPEINEMTGKVDYKDLKLFVHVSEGQKLVSRTPATQGRCGYTVTGRKVKQKRGKEAKLPAGKNVTYDKERRTMFAGVNGSVEYKNNTVTVSSCYTVSGDADLSVGNVRFDGDVVIKGNVISDITIHATKNIEVYGVAEGARLIAGGNIILRNGMLGNDKGIIEARGNVTAKYIERAKIRAGGDIKADALIHCVAESGGNIDVKGRHGSIIGGEIKAQNSIMAQIIGSVVNNKTNIEVGLPPQKRARMKFLGAELERLRKDIEKYDKAIGYLTRLKNLPPEKEQLKKTIILEKIHNTKLLGEYDEESKALEEDAKKSEMGKIHVTDTIYPGVKLTISLGEYTVSTPVRYSTFYCKNREILFTACQL